MAISSIGTVRKSRNGESGRAFTRGAARARLRPINSPPAKKQMASLCKETVLTGRVSKSKIAKKAKLKESQTMECTPVMKSTGKSQSAKPKTITRWRTAMRLVPMGKLPQLATCSTG